MGGYTKTRTSESWVTVMNEHSEELSDEELANDRWENEGGHTELAQLHKTLPQESSPYLVMNTHLKNFAKKRFNADLETLPEREQRVMAHYRERLPISRDTSQEFTTTSTFGQRLADKVATFGGSWTFIIIFATVLVSWVVLNSIILARRDAAFDPYPYILLNLFLSMLAAIQAPIILMSQNRQSVKDRLNAAHDYEVNLKAELEILSLHEKLDELRDGKWTELITLQQEQISLLTQLVKEQEVIKN